MKVLITAGGTTEKIDAVRAITNTGTGRLGALIADAFAVSPVVDGIFYVCSGKAVRPQNGKTVVRIADDTHTLQETITDICGKNPIGAVIHSMAVSDYRTRSITTAAALATRLAATAPPDVETAATMIRNIPGIAPPGGKISSDVEDLVVILERTPKVIAQLRELAPEAIIVGFKLLTNADEAVLLDTAYALLRKNDCDYVLANDLSLIGDGSHIGHLMDREKKTITWQTKQDIAEGIAKTVLSHGVHRA
jgi:phosphopantothenate-cysteine ligase